MSASLPSSVLDCMLVCLPPAYTPFLLACLSACLSVCLPLSFLLCLPARPPVTVSSCLSACSYVCLSACLILSGLSTLHLEAIFFPSADRLLFRLSSSSIINRLPVTSLPECCRNLGKTIAMLSSHGIKARNNCLNNNAYSSPRCIA